mmetsp:Transcript_23566/g.29497  ORF Transcript_23566/g.29497 Transcript_23566/m.29497 type:complete len:971 (+) Transcript_23566:182-3094(+)
MCIVDQHQGADEDDHLQIHGFSTVDLEELFSNLEENLCNDLESYKLEYHTSFKHYPAKKEWILSKHKKQIRFCEIGTIMNCFYFVIARVLVHWCPLLEHHCGGSMILNILLCVSIVNGILLLLSKHFGPLKSKIKSLVEKDHPCVFGFIFYPILFLRCLGYLEAHTIYTHDLFQPALQLEDLSFWCYIFLWCTMSIFVAKTSYLLTLPGFVLPSTFSMISLYVAKTLAGMLNIGVQFVGSLAFALILFLAARALVLEHKWEMLYQRSVSREKNSIKSLCHQQTKAMECIIKEKSTVFGELAHDIGSPLSVISMGVDLLLDSHKEQDRQILNSTQYDETRDILQGLSAAISIIVVLRQSMLDYVKKVHGVTLKPSLEPIHILRFLSKKIYPILKNLLGSKATQIKPQWKLDKRLLGKKVMSSESWLTDMLLNYISNAVKFTENGYIEISASLQKDRKNIRFEVVDSGPGIDKESASKLFREFGQAQKDKGGTGLGIYSVKKKAKLLGGDAGFRENLDAGSIFYFTIPFNQCSDHCEESMLSSMTMSMEPIRNRAENTKGRKIFKQRNHQLKKPSVLVVDDSPLVLKLTCGILRKCKVSSIECAPDAVKAMEIINTPGKWFDLIFMDDQMPGMRGPELAHRIFEKFSKKNSNCPELYILTGNSAAVLEADFPDICRSVHAIYEKPVSLATVRNILDGKDVTNNCSPFTASYHSTNANNSLVVGEQKLSIEGEFLNNESDIPKPISDSDIEHFLQQKTDIQCLLSSLSSFPSHGTSSGKMQRRKKEKSSPQQRYQRDKNSESLSSEKSLLQRTIGSASIQNKLQNSSDQTQKNSEFLSSSSASIQHKLQNKSVSPFFECKETTGKEEDEDIIYISKLREKKKSGCKHPAMIGGMGALTAVHSEGMHNTKTEKKKFGDMPLLGRPPKLSPIELKNERGRSLTVKRMGRRSLPNISNNIDTQLPKIVERTSYRFS